MPDAKITSKGQLTIPVEVRNALGLDTGDSVVLEVQGDYAVLRKKPRLSDVVGEMHRKREFAAPKYGSKREAVTAHFQDTWEDMDGPVLIARPPKRDSST